ncbi:uncharacterized protein GGS22DRAFT_159579 [Annulohypoxylon maeteangense]|uniref:uncharacterized protein n=1 Tax=Annulohypoxylon maeteangense TaxID=1927788 RepID=UPI0020085C98|nr:uncharacterized protein GGS22DRAFT_159579 [Annulohypoxylon maeteangense]KAI0886005.1 hypothetical protein GGS22DRAFT_159579 [Annulohypoxylon maeteangense]
MPALPSALLLDTLVTRNLTLDSAASSLAATTTNVENALQVVCAWPVSGQYGPGSRVLYYVLVAACVIARKAEWLRSACLAAALIFPAVAAIHGIVLAAVHVDGAVDMDVYGAFQFCSIGILAAPLTVRISKTYFNDPGRNIIFLWTGIVLAGLLSLTVEFFRASPSPCTHDDDGNPIDVNDLFGFLNENVTCNLTCSITAGPFSPLRQNATNEIFVIPAPTKLAFNAAVLLAAACCIPAVLSLASMWNKILEINWKSRFGLGDGDQLIEGTNGATVARMSGVNAMVRLFLSTLEIPIFSAAVLAILIFGELNLWSIQVLWQTEPIASIGQWAPIVGTVLAALGSLYVLLSVDMDAISKGEKPEPFTHHCNCSHHHFDDRQYPSPHPDTSSSGGSVNTESAHECSLNHIEHTSRNSPSMQEVGNGGLFIDSSHPITAPGAARLRSSSSNSRGEASADITSTANTTDIGHRRRVYRSLLKVSTYLGTANKSQFDDSEFKHGKALDFPEVPAEEQRNPDLPRVREVYNQHREDELAALSNRPSRAGSFAGSISSRVSIEDYTISRAISAPHPPSRASSPSPAMRGIRHTSTLPVGQGSSVSTRGRSRQRSNTLTVPEPDNHSRAWSTRAVSPVAPASPVSHIEASNVLDNGPGSPAIVISPVSGTNSTVEEPITLSPPIIQPPPESKPPHMKSSPPPT